jgi:hypothetical protein
MTESGRTGRTCDVEKLLENLVRARLTPRGVAIEKLNQDGFPVDSIEMGPEGLKNFGDFCRDASISLLGEEAKERQEGRDHDA